MGRTYLVTGAASGIGQATTHELRADGHTAIGVDIKGAGVTVDLGTAPGRAELVERVGELSGGRIDAIVAVVAVAGRVAANPVTVGANHFGARATLEGLRPLLARSPAPRAAVVASLAA